MQPVGRWRLEGSWAKYGQPIGTWAISWNFAWILFLHIVIHVIVHIVICVVVRVVVHVLLLPFYLLYAAIHVIIHIVVHVMSMSFYFRFTWRDQHLLPLSLALKHSVEGAFFITLILITCQQVRYDEQRWYHIMPFPSELLIDTLTNFDHQWLLLRRHIQTTFWLRFYRSKFVLSKIITYDAVGSFLAGYAMLICARRARNVSVIWWAMAGIGWKEIDMFGWLTFLYNNSTRYQCHWHR